MGRYLPELETPLRSIAGAKLRMAQEEVNQQARIACRALLDGRQADAEAHASLYAEAQLRVDELVAEVRGLAVAERDRQEALA